MYTSSPFMKKNELSCDPKEAQDRHNTLEKKPSHENFLEKEQCTSFEEKQEKKLEETLELV